MPAAKETTNKFYEDIKTHYLKLISVKKDGIPVYSQEFVLHTVAKKFYRSPRTVENIVYNRL
jgi:hypothetical protein